MIRLVAISNLDFSQLCGVWTLDKSMYKPKTIESRAFLKIVPRITILEIWHYEERFAFQHICTQEFLVIVNCKSSSYENHALTENMRMTGSWPCLICIQSTGCAKSKRYSSKPLSHCESTGSLYISDRLKFCNSNIAYIWAWCYTAGGLQYFDCHHSLVPNSLKYSSAG